MGILCDRSEDLAKSSGRTVRYSQYLSKDRINTIVPYVYDDAYLYWKAIWEAQVKNENVELKDFVLPVKEIHIDSPKRQPMKHLRKLFTFLEEGENE